MLRFIIGTNEEARRKILYEDIAKEKSAFLIVPEQFSFESEKLLDEFLGVEKSQNVEVLSFSRLCNSIFRKFGGIAGEYTDDTAKLLLMGAALSACEDELRYYKKNIHGAPFIQNLLRQIPNSKMPEFPRQSLALFLKKAELSAKRPRTFPRFLSFITPCLKKAISIPLPI